MQPRGVDNGAITFAGQMRAFGPRFGDYGQPNGIVNRRNVALEQIKCGADGVNGAQGHHHIGAAVALVDKTDGTFFHHGGVLTKGAAAPVVDAGRGALRRNASGW